jgi:hypothetical protein
MTYSTSLHSRQAHVMSVIDSDFDEDDEYNQCEIDEIFSISPTTTELYNDGNSQEIMFNHRGGAAEDYYGCGGSEFDSEEIITAHGLNSDIHHNKNHIQPTSSQIPDDDDDEEEDDVDYRGSSAIAATNAFK